MGGFWPGSKAEQRDEKLATIIFGDDGTDDNEFGVDKDAEVAVKPALDVKQGDAPGITSPGSNTDLTLFKSDVELAEVGALQFWETIGGGRVASNLMMDILVGEQQVKFVRPVAVCVRGDLVYVVDMGLHAVYRYHRVTGEVERVLGLLDIVSGDVADIYVNKDLSFYITDTYGSRVLKYNHNGKLLQIYKNRLNLVRPVSVVEDERTGSVLVADGEFDHVLVFNQVGDPFTTIGRRGQAPGEFLNITAMALTNDDVYVASRVGGRLQVLSREGEYLYTIEQDVMRFPLSLVVSDGRVFSSDYLDNSIKVFERGLLVESVGGTGVVPGKFKRITDLWIEDGFLFVADSLNGRIQVMKVTGAVSSVAPTPGR